MFIDSHAHIDLVLDKESFHRFHKKETSSVIISEIFSTNLELAIHISLDPLEFEKSYSSLKDNKKIVFATGIYPDRVSQIDFNENEQINRLRKILITYPHVAIGETGIDLKHAGYGPLQKQESLFRRHFELAQELNLPVIIHSRDSFEECFRVVSDYPDIKIVFHCFTYGRKEAELILQHGGYISFSGILTYKKSSELHELVQDIPLDKIFFETDAPYLSPEPFRGKWNMPKYVEHTYRYFAYLREISLEELCSKIKNNIADFFNI